MDFDWLKFARLAGAGLASICTFLFGAPDIWLLTLLAFIVIDYISGVIAAYIHHELSSQVGFIGILKKTMYFFVVAVAHCVDVATGAGGVLQGIPEKLIRALEQIRGDEQEKKKGPTD